MAQGPIWGQEGTRRDTSLALTSLSQQQQPHEGQSRMVTPRHGHHGDRGHPGPGAAGGPQPHTPGVTPAFPIPFPVPVSPCPHPQRGQMAVQEGRKEVGFGAPRMLGGGLTVGAAPKNQRSLDRNTAGGVPSSSPPAFICATHTNGSPSTFIFLLLLLSSSSSSCQSPGPAQGGSKPWEPPHGSWAPTRGG